MARSAFVGLVFDGWNAIDQALAGLTPADAARRIDGDPSFAWTLGHVTHMVDSWINVNFQRRPPHPVVNVDRFRAGSSGEAMDWESIRAGVEEVRVAAGAYLQDLADADLDRRVPYHGSLAVLQGRDLTLRYALLRIAAHHFLHTGAIISARARLGLPVADADFAGFLTECLDE